MKDPVRSLMAIAGVVLAVVLMIVQAAIFLGAVRSSSLLVRQSDADLWLVPETASNADFSAPMPQRRRYQALGIDGVARAGRMVVGFANWRFPSGRQESVIVVGTDRGHAWLPIEPGRLHLEQSVILDERERYRFASDDRLLDVGDRGELSGHAIEVAGFVRGMNSFPITPYVFMRYERALDCTPTEAGETTFVLVKCDEGADVSGVQGRLQARIPDVEVLTRQAFADRAWRYWVLGTGMGMALSLSAILALVVGMVVVGQTIFTGVLTKLREYGTLKALGFSNRFVGGTVVAQGAIVAIVGYAIGIGASQIVIHFWGQGGTAVSMHAPPTLYYLLLPVTLAMCIVSSLFAAGKALLLSPAEVFR